jgi:hypothetical protein
MGVVCRICSKECESDESFHRHLKFHRTKQEVYYQKYFPRHDKLDGSFIEYKNREHYLTSDFNSRANMHAWFKKASPLEAQEYVRDWFLRRKERKKLVYAPTQVELRGLPIPGAVYLNKLFGSYCQFAESIGLKVKFSEVGFSGNWNAFGAGHYIMVDSREQMPLDFFIKTRVQKLEYGDYKLNDDKFSHHCVIERKSMNDLFNTLNVGLVRFRNEIQRSIDDGCSLVILVEQPFEAIYKQENFYRAFYGGRVSAEFVLFNMRDMLYRFPNIQFLFVANRKEAARAVELLLRSNGEFRNVDLQFAYDSGTFKLGD